MTEFVELKTETEWLKALPILAQLYPYLTKDYFLATMAEITARGYHLFALKQDDAVLSVIGVQELIILSSGPLLWIIDFVTDEPHRHRGYGRQLLEYVDEYAAQRGYEQVRVHSSFPRQAAHRLFEKHLGFQKWAFVFRKFLDMNSVKREA